MHIPHEMSRELKLLIVKESNLSSYGQLLFLFKQTVDSSQFQLQKKRKYS